MNQYPWLWIVFVSLAALTSLSWQRTPLSSHRDPYQIFTYENHPCRRGCHEDAPSMTCRYYFLLEHYSTMTKECSDCPSRPSHCYLPHCVPGNGVVRGILTVNRMLPGPLIYVCEGDEIEVVVDNKMELGEGTSIHWHGLKQHGTQFMDGTNLVTQCPIHAGSKMLYKLRADDVGTHFWHAHSAIQRSGGIFGGIVIRQSRSRDPQAHLYDHDLAEHVILLTDWHSRPIGETFSRNYFDKPMDPDAILINGLGRTSSGLLTPYPIFRVNAGQRYRFRVASNGIMNCPIVVSIDGHRLLVIATDGQDVRAVAVDSLVIYGGERFDFVVRARKRIQDNFWIRFQGQGRCEEARVFQAAILRYNGATEDEPTPPATFNNTVMGEKTLNDARSAPSPSNLQIVDLKTLDPNQEDERQLIDIPDKQFYIAMGSSELETPRFHPTHQDMTSSKAISHPKKPSVRQAEAPKRPHGLMISSKDNNSSTKPIVYHFNYILSILPPSPPLSQYKDIPKNMFCDNTTVTEDCTRTVCECVHRLHFSLGDLVEMVLVGFKSGPAHPIHMHGHAFRVVSMMPLNQTVTVEQIQEMDKKEEITRIASGAPFKDTILVHSPGLTIIRFRASNPGFWLFHCHIDFHAETGMSLILQSGNLDDMPRPPPHFPRCGDWIPDDNDDLEPDDASVSDFKTQSTLASIKLSRETTLSRQLPSTDDTKTSDKFFEIRTNSDDSVGVSARSRVSVNQLEIRKGDVKNQDIPNKPQLSPVPPATRSRISLQRTTSTVRINDKPLNSPNHFHGNEHQNKSTAASKPQTLSSVQTTGTRQPLTSESPNSTADDKPHLYFITCVFIGLVLILIVAATYAGRGRSCCERRGAFKGQGRGYSGNKTGLSLQATLKTGLILDKNPADYLSIMATLSNKE